jgi:hypothetical protein
MFSGGLDRASYALRKSFAFGLNLPHEFVDLMDAQSSYPDEVVSCMKSLTNGRGVR